MRLGGVRGEHANVAAFDAQLQVAQGEGIGDRGMRGEVAGGFVEHARLVA